MNLKEKYNKEVVPAMHKQFALKNIFAVPKIEKVTINIGLSRNLTEKDAKFIDSAREDLIKITGQRPIERKARQSISGFKIREGLVVGLMVTLRGARMYDFLDKLINVALPRTRDFRGINSSSIDASGNLSIGVREHLVFPEIHPEDLQKNHGLQVTITTNAHNREKGLELFKLLGFPFKGD